MAADKITKRTVDGVTPGKVDCFLWDSEVRGFGLKITPAGNKVYLYQYRLGGRGNPTRRYTIGKHGALTPDQARAMAKKLAHMVEQGIDPRQAEDEARAAKDEAKRATDERKRLE